MKQLLTILDFPDPADARRLSPNGRASWQDKRRARMRIGWKVHQALTYHCPLRAMTGPVRLQPTFVFPERRKRDMDNLSTGVLKVVIDLLVRAGVLEADDSEHLYLEPVQVQVEPGQRRLVVTLVECGV